MRVRFLVPGGGVGGKVVRGRRGGTGRELGV